MKTPENFGPTPEDKERELMGQTEPMNMDEFKKTAEEMARKAKELGFEAAGQLPPEPIPEENNRDLAA